MARRWPTKLFKDRADEFLKLYPGDTDAQALRSAVDFGSDQFIAFGTWKWLEAHRKTSDAPVYRYHFELAALPSKYHPGTFAFHSDDIEYVFGTLDTRPGETVRPEDRQLSEAMMTYWTNFAKNGDPNGAGVPTWPKYDTTDNSLIHLNSPITCGPGHDAGSVFYSCCRVFRRCVSSERHPLLAAGRCREGGGAPPYSVKKVSFFNGLGRVIDCKVLSRWNLAAESSQERA